MTDVAKSPAEEPNLLKKLMTPLALIGLVLAIATEIPRTFSNISKLITAHQTAVNASVTQHAVAATAAANAITALEEARNAAKRMKAEADKSVADANTAASNAVTESAKAANALRKAKAEADGIVAEAASNLQKAQIKLQEARLAALAKKTEADQAEQDLKNSRLNLRASVYNATGLINCPGNTYIAKIESFEEGHCPQARWR